MELEQQPLVWVQELNEVLVGELNELMEMGMVEEKEWEPAGKLGQNVRTGLGGGLPVLENCAKGVGKLLEPEKKQ